MFLLKESKLAKCSLAALIVVIFTFSTFLGVSAYEEETYVAVNNNSTYFHYQPDYEGARIAAEELGVNFKLQGPAENNVSKMINTLNTVIAQEPDGLMVYGWSPQLAGPINKALDAGIPTVTIDADVPGSNALSFIGSDWHGIGEKLAEELANAIGGEGKVAGFLAPSINIFNYAWEGFTSHIEENYPEIKIVEKIDDEVSKSKAASKAAAVLQRHPDLAGFAGFDASSGPGIGVALREANKCGEVKLVSNDIHMDQLKLLENGCAQSVIGQNRKAFGYYGVKMLYDYNHTNITYTEKDKELGISTIPPRVVTGIIEVTPENIDAMKKAFSKYEN